MSWQSILDDPSFKSQDDDTKRRVADNYYRDVIEADPEYRAQSEDVKARVRTNFFGSIMPPAPERGLVGDVASHLARGVVGQGFDLASSALKTLDSPGGTDIVRGLGDTLEGYHNEWPKKYEILKPSKGEESEGTVRRQIMEGIESMPTSVAPTLAGMGAGALYGAAGGPVGAAAGALIGGLVGSTVASGFLFGLGSYGKAKEEALKAGKSEDEAHWLGVREGLIEFGIEEVSNVAGMLTMGTGKVLTSAAKQPAKQAIKQIFKMPAKELVARALGTAAIETSTEMLQNSWEAYNREKLGMVPAGSWKDAAIDSIIPALTMTALFGAGSASINAYARNNIMKDLNSEKPEERQKAALIIGKELKDYDAELAAKWFTATKDAFDKGEKIHVNQRMADFISARVKDEQKQVGQETGQVAAVDQQDDVDAETADLINDAETPTVEDVPTAPPSEGLVPPEPETPDMRPLASANWDSVEELAGKGVKAAQDELAYRNANGLTRENYGVGEVPTETGLAPTEAQAETGPVRGTLGMKLAEGQVVLTTSGRETTPFPVLVFGTERKTKGTVAKVDEWLVGNALAEAQARGDEFNALQFGHMNAKNLSQADKDSAEMYLFGEKQPTPVKKAIHDINVEQKPAAAFIDAQSADALLGSFYDRRDQMSVAQLDELVSKFTEDALTKNAKGIERLRGLMVVAEDRAAQVPPYASLLRDLNAIELQYGINKPAREINQMTVGEAEKYQESLKPGVLRIAAMKMVERLNTALEENVIDEKEFETHVDEILDTFPEGPQYEVLRDYVRGRAKPSVLAKAAEIRTLDGDPNGVYLDSTERTGMSFVHGDGNVASAEKPIESESGRRFYKESGYWYFQPQGRDTWTRVTNPDFSTKIERWYKLATGGQEEQREVRAPLTAEKYTADIAGAVATNKSLADAVKANYLDNFKLWYRDKAESAKGEYLDRLIEQDAYDDVNNAEGWFTQAEQDAAAEKLYNEMKAQEVPEADIEEEVKNISDEDLDQMLEETKPKDKPAVRTNTRQATAETATKEAEARKTARNALDEFADHASAGFKEGLAALDELFGDKGTLRMGPAITPESYAKAKPHLDAMFAEFSAAKRSLKEFVQALVDKFGDSIKPYVKAFVRERKGLPPLEETAEETTTEPTTEVEGEQPEETEEADEAEEGEEAEEEGEAPTEGKPDTTGGQRKPKKAKGKKRGPKVENAGDLAPGKRFASQYKAEFEGDQTGNVVKDIKRMLSKASKAAIWPVSQPAGATPGVMRYLTAIREGMLSPLESIGKFYGGRLGKYRTSYIDAMTGYASESPENMQKVVGQTATYAGMVAELAEATKDATTVAQARDALIKLLYTQTEEEAPSVAWWKRWTDIGTWFGDTRVLNKSSDSERYLKNIAELYESGENNVITKPKSLMQRTKNAALVREGLTDFREGKDVTPQQVLDEYGLKSAEFGNWTTNEERQRYVNLLYDSLGDMAKVLGLPNQAMGYGGALNWAFGSRGNEMSKASAFYQGGERRLINTTKTKGDGTVSHEWGHSFDDLAPRMSADYDGATRLTSAIDDFKEELRYTYDIDRAKELMEGWLSVKSISELERVAPRTSGMSPKEAVKKLLTEWFTDPDYGIRKRSDYFINARAIDGSASKMYWAKHQEMFARAFESYIYDTLDGMNNFLVNDWVADSQTTEETGYVGTPYPKGDERAYFNSLFEKLFKAVTWKDGRFDYDMEQGLVSKQVENEVRALLQDSLDRVDQLYEQMHRVEPSEDGLYWYAYRSMSRAMRMQPEGYMAFDDKYASDVEGVSGIGAVGYLEGLPIEDVIAFNLQGIAYAPTESVVYLDIKGGVNDVTVGGDDGTLDGTPSEDGGEAEGRGPVRGGRRGGRAHGKRGNAGANEGGDGRISGVEHGGRNVFTPAGRDGRTESGPGQDAVSEPVDYKLTDADGIGELTPVQRFTYNLTALQTLKNIEAEGRLATAEEQSVLAKYSGWGGLTELFDWRQDESWAERKRLLTDLLDGDEYYEARRSIQNAFYTSPDVVRAMYSALERFGFKGGRVLEPAVGTGNFLGMMPDEMYRNSVLSGVELDALTSRIAHQLYQKARIQNMGFEEAKYPENFFDLVISNVPFGQNGPTDKVYNKQGFSLHDYFFGKSIKLVRPGGIVAFITSRWTMDKGLPRLREMLTAEADLLGAVRLPNTAFKKNAGTEVVTDIIFLRRKLDNAPAVPELPWVNIERTQAGQGAFAESHDINEHYVAHPDMMMGRLAYKKDRGGEEISAVMDDGRDLAASLAEAISKFPADVITQSSLIPDQQEVADKLPAPDDVLEGEHTVQDGKLYKRVSGELVRVEEKTTAQKHFGQVLRDALPMRSAFRDLVRGMASPETTEEELKAKQAALNKAYDKFVKKHGYLSAEPELSESGRQTKASAQQILNEDAAGVALLSLEEYGPGIKTPTKAYLLTAKTLRAKTEIEKVESPADGVPVSLNKFGYVNLDYIATLTGMPRTDVREALRGVVFDDPERGLMPADLYLSGNVRRKLEVAKQAAEADPSFNENVAALEKVQPTDIPPNEIAIRLGAPWVPLQYVHDFVTSLVPGANSLRLSYIKELGRFKIEFDGNRSTKSTAAYDTPEARLTWGTPRINFFDLLDYALNGGVPSIIDVVDGPTGSKRVVNAGETEAAKAMLEAIKTEFGRWALLDIERAKEIGRVYNDEYNNLIETKFDGEFLAFEGMSPAYILRAVQKNAIWRALANKTTYLAHRMGVGKTFEMIAIAHESKRLGFAKKTIIAAMNANYMDIAADYLKLYPTANILVIDVSGIKELRKGQADLEADAKEVEAEEVQEKADSAELEKNKAYTEKRRVQLHRIMTGNYDAIIMSHQSLTRIGLSPLAEAQYLRSELERLEGGLAEMRMSGESKRSVNDIVKAIERYRADLNEVMAKHAKVTDSDIYFDQLGVDQIIVDEAHEFKNLFFTTALGNVVGVTSGTKTGRSVRLHAKTEWLHQNAGRIVFASGTPLSNSVAELYSIQRYLQPEVLREKGIPSFDTWANTFGVVGSELEYRPEGGGFRMVNKFKAFVNRPELLHMTYATMDIASLEDAGIKVPKHELVVVKVPKNEAVAAFDSVMVERAKAVRRAGWNNYPVNPATGRPDIMFTVIEDGLKVALDARLLDKHWNGGTPFPDYEDTKTNYAVTRILEEYRRGSRDIVIDGKAVPLRGVQLVFSDIGVPGGKSEVNLYRDIKEKLVKDGIPESEIVFIHDADKGNKEAKKALKQKLMRDVRAGRIRVLLGSTQKMGTGVNLQDRVIAIHHLNADWNASALEQRNARGIRWGNLLVNLQEAEDFPLNEYRYVTLKTVDAFKWDKIAAKTRLIDDFMGGDMTARQTEDISTDSIGYAELMAIAADDPVIMEQVQVDSRLNSLRLQRRAYDDRQFRMKLELAEAPGRLDGQKVRLPKLEEANALLGQVNGIKYVNPKGETVFYPLEKSDKYLADIKASVAKLENTLEVRHRATGNAIFETIATLGTVKAIEETTGEGENKKTVIRHEWVADVTPLSAARLNFLGTQLAVRVAGFQDSVMPEAGVLRLMSSVRSGVEQAIVNTKAEIARLTDLMPKLETEIQKPFEHGEEFDRLTKRSVEIAAMFANMATGHDANARPTAAVMETGAPMKAYEADPALKPEDIAYQWTTGDHDGQPYYIVGRQAVLLASEPLDLKDADLSLTESPDDYWETNTSGLPPKGDEVKPVAWTLKYIKKGRTTETAKFVWFNTGNAIQSSMYDLLMRMYPSATFNTFVEHSGFGVYNNGKLVGFVKTTVAGNIYEVLPLGVRKLIEKYNRGEIGDDGVILDFMGLQKMVIGLGRLTGDLKAAMPKLVELGHAVYQRGAVKLSDWLDEMRRLMGKVFESFKGSMVKVYAEVKKGPLGNERGSITLGGAETPDVNIKDSAPAEKETWKEGDGFDEQEEMLEVSRGIKEHPVRERLKEGTLKVVHSFRRMFVHLDPKTDGAVMDLLRLYVGASTWSREQAEADIKEITKGLDKDQYDIFRKYLILADLVRDIRSGLYQGALPFKYKSRAQVEAHLRQYRNDMKADDAIREAVKKRGKVIGDLRRKLVEEKILSDKVLSSPANEYFHHQVLEHYAVEKLGMGTGMSELHKRRYGWQIARTGSDKSFNTEYIQAEYEVLAQGYHALATAKVRDRIQELEDISTTLAKSAKKLNRQAVFDKLKRLGMDGVDPFLPFRQYIAMSFNKLGELAASGDLPYPVQYTGIVEDMKENYEFKKANKADMADSGQDIGRVSTDDPQVFEFLSWLLENGGEGAMQAATIFKAIREREKFTKETLGSEYKTASDLIPEGHVEWQFEKGRQFYVANTISDKILAQVLGKEKALEATDIRTALAVGRRKPVWIIPERLANTLDGFKPVEHGTALGLASESIMNSWKQWILLNPVRVLKYNINNMSGDLDIVFAYDPKIISGYMRQSARDLYAHMKGQELAPGVKDYLDKAFELQVVNSGITAKDIPDIRRSGVFKTLTGERDNLVTSYWDTVKDYTTFRENILRLAAYRSFLEKESTFRAEGRTFSPGASDATQIMQMRAAGASVEEVAARLARDLVGDYGNISEAGQWLRRRMIPFYSWMEINAPRYVRLLKNLKYAEGGDSVEGRMAVIGGKKLFTASLGFTLKATALYTLVILWNATFFPDEEDELGLAQRRQLHLILGRRADGTIMSMRFQGALSDALSWFGLENFPVDYADILQGKKSVGDMTKEMALAPFQRIVQGSLPVQKAVYESITRKSLYPDFTSPRPVRDRLEHMLQTFSLDMPYRYLAGKPTRGLGAELPSVVAYTSDPGENAYYNTIQRAVDFLKKHETEVPSITPTDKSNALYYYKQALKYGDKDAAKKYREEYFRLGGSRRGIALSSKKMAPIAFLPKKYRVAFMRSLSPDERVQYNMAKMWWRETYIRKQNIRQEVP